MRLGDVNGDGLQDITTGWEEGGVIRLYLNPGELLVKQRWPAMTVGRVASPEDAVFVDLDNDGAVDVVSSTEGEDRTIYVHWAPKRAEDYLDEGKWKTAILGPSRGMMRWMFALPLEIDFRRGIDLVAGGKDSGARIGWFESPDQARGSTEWEWHELCRAGWIMSLVATDMDADGDTDILVSDRKGAGSGIFWLENPGPGPRLTSPWRRHRIGNQGEEVMFLTEFDLNRDDLPDVVAAVRPRTIAIHLRDDAAGRRWRELRIPLPRTAGTAKAVKAADIDLDGKPDLVCSCEHADGELSGVIWLSYSSSITDPQWVAHDVSGKAGVKFDRVELLDIDSDGDLDILTCEEVANLGVIWYENPTR